MTEPTKEQIKNWTSEAEKHFPRPFWGGRDGDMDEWHGKIEGYLAAKKSDFEEIESLKRVYNLIADSNTEKIFKIEDMESEIKTLKEQLAKAEEVLKMCNDGEMFISNGEYNELFKYQYKEWFQDWIDKYFAEKEKQEKQDKENKDEK